MSEEGAIGSHANDGREGRRGGGALILIGVAVLLAYPLSTGPVVKLADSGVIPQSAIMQIYGPLILLSDRSTVIAGFFEWYVGLWAFK